MKPNKTVLVLAITLLGLAVTLFFVNHQHSKVINHQAAIETTKANFLKQLNQPGISVDSTYVIKDTLRFYSKGSFLGMSVIVKE